MRPYPRNSAIDDDYAGESSLRLPRFLKRTRTVAKVAAAGGAAILGVAALGAAATVATAAAARRRRAERLRGKTVVITGSSRGLGLALAEEFGRQGARIVLTARDAEELYRAHQLLLDIDAVAGPQDTLVIPADLRKKEDAEELIRRVSEAWGPVDVLVNNAGVITVGPVENQSLDDFREVMESNFFTGLNCTLSALPAMLKRGSGTIVNITSIGGKVAVPHLLPYTASKFAAVGFSEGLHAEMRSKGIHVLTVCPGLMRTGSHVNALFAGNAEREYQWFSLGATTPGVAASARSAARRIVRAVLARETEIFITPQAALAGRLAQVSPAVTATAMSLVNRILPDPIEDSAGPRRGADVRKREPAVASVLGWNAARRYNEVDATAEAR
ncbi:SDR family NAD(P)-dependent oxidoreductase [Acidobacteria bacterium AB60]|nr:SDR family NAD(P)-dependent oxidoreductase [Acidobacteria bacterium AB60]